MTQNPENIDRKALLKNALVALDEMQARLDAQERQRSEPIAIVGMGCRFPGGADNPEAYWQALSDKVDAVRQVPADRWRMEDYQAVKDGQSISWYGGFLDQVDRFDPQFFGISPREAATMDPQQRLVLEVVWEALESAGIAPDSLGGSAAGVFIGVTTNDYSQITKGVGAERLDVYTATGGALNVVAGRVAYTLGLNGPCASIDTACSSSLVATHLAIQSLRNGESELVIAGGVNVLLTPEPFICFSEWGMMAPDGHCKTFDTRADGFVRGEGCGIIILKRLSDAQRDGDPILALIRGSAVNQDGRSSGLTVPNGLAQQAVIRKALANSGVRPSEVSYVEAHGTGTSLGDPIEVEAIGIALGEGRPADSPLFLGSVKTNLGHLESASGIAGLIKVVLSMQHSEIPAHLNFQERSPRIPWPSFPTIIPTEKTSWPGIANRRIAGVSSFGFSGTNAHIVLEQAPQPAPAGFRKPRPQHLLVLSARTEAALEQLASRYERRLATHPHTDLVDLTHTAARGRARFSHRLALVAAAAEEMGARLASLATGVVPAGVSRGQALPPSAQKIAFLFTGQGSQYVGMGAQLYESEPVFRAALERCDALLRPHLERSLLAVLFPAPGESSPIDETAYTQPALFALEYALAELWRSWGIQPAYVMGHSVGEYVAACLAGVFSLEDGLKLIAARGRLMQSLPAGGGMAAVFAEEALVAGAIAAYPAQLAIAGYNGPANIVISGDGAALKAVLERLAAQGIKSQPLVVSHAFHSPLMEPILAEFSRVAASIQYNAPRLALISNLTGQPADARITTPAYWVDHIRQPVRFARSIAALDEMGCQVFLEIGPKPTLLGMGRRCLAEGAGHWLASLRSGRDDWAQMLESLGGLFVLGREIHWDALEKDYAPRRIALLPTYPFQRSRHWVEAESQLKSSGRAAASGGHPLLGVHIPLASLPGAHLWQGALDLERLPYLADHRVQGLAVLPATAYVEMAVAAAAQIWGEGPLGVSEIENKRVLVLSEEKAYTLQVVLNTLAEGQARFEIYSQARGGNPGAASQAAWTLHVTGKVHRVQPEAAPQAPFDFEAIRQRCTQEIDGAAFYRRMAEKGNQWGPAFQGLQAAWRGDHEALSRVQAPEVLGSQAASYRFHPAVSDACGHVLMAPLALLPPGEAQSGAIVGGSIREARIYRPARDAEYITYARLQLAAEHEQHGLVGDVQVYTTQGELVSETLGARLVYLDRDQNNLLFGDLEDWFYEVSWQVSAPPAPDLAATPEPRAWLVLSDRQGAGEALAAAMAGEGQTCILAQAGSEFENLGPDRYRLNPGQPADFDRLLAEVAAGGSPPIRGILHLWSLDAAPGDQLTDSSLADAQALGCYSALHLAKSLARHRQDPTPRLWLVTRGVQSLPGQVPGDSFAQATLWGFGRALSAEHNELWGGLVDLAPGGDLAQEAGMLARLVLHPDGEDQVALRNGQRFVARLVEKTSFEFQSAQLQFRPEAAYLITGGLGGLGLKVAEWMAAHGARRLVLMSRTPLPPRAEWEAVNSNATLRRRIAAIQGLESQGVEVLTAAVDVADPEMLRAFLEEYRQAGQPAIAGVIHAAGLMEYQPLLAHTPADMDAIMRPKVTGGWLLHHLLGADLDFFVLFSSASALLSPPLMVSYVAANTFLDALARYRRARGLPALSVNWGSWAEVGMASDFSSAGHQGIIRGMGQITPEQGLQALERLMRSGATQASLIPVNWLELQRHYPASSSAPMLSALMARRAPRPASSEQVVRIQRSQLLSAETPARQAMLVSYLREKISDVLGASPASLDEHEALTNMGLDSLMALELKNRIDADLELGLPLVQLLQGPSITGLAGYLAESLADSHAEEALTLGKGIPHREFEIDDMIEKLDAPGLLSNLGQLTDDQVEKLLRELSDDEG